MIHIQLVGRNWPRNGIFRIQVRPEAIGQSGQYGPEVPVRRSAECGMRARRIPLGGFPERLGYATVRN